MSGQGSDHVPADRPRDPFLRFLAGCLVVVAIITAVVLSGGVLVGWRLARDETPGRARESFFVGDEARYWCLDLRPDDKGLLALFARFGEINETTRRKALRGTFLESFPLPHRDARLNEVAPLTLEFAMATSGGSATLPVPSGWSARGTFSKGVFKLRAALKIMRFFASREPGKSSTFEVDGVAVTELRDRNAAFAFATLGNRVIVTSGGERMRAALSPSAEPEAARLEGLIALHDQVALDGEDAWGFLAPMRLGDLSDPFTIGGATASFDVNERDELSFSVVVPDAGAASESPAFRGSREECAAVAGAFLPGVPDDAIEIDEQGARRGDGAGLVFSGRISGVSGRLAELLGRVTDLPRRERSRMPGVPEMPSASPTPPSPPPPAGRRSENP